MEGLNSRNCLGVEVRGEQRSEKQKSGGKWEGTKGKTRGAQRSERQAYVRWETGEG